MLLWLLLFLSPAPQFQDQLRTHVQFLSSDLLEGRDTGYRGQQIAAQYLISQLKLAGLQPLGADKNEPYLQTYDLIATRLDKTRFRADFVGKGPRFAAKVDQDLSLFFHGQGLMDGKFELVFGGFGYTEPGFNEMAHLDLNGKWVIFLIGSPEPKVGTNPFKEPLPKLGLRKRFAMARLLGAKGGILVIPDKVGDEGASIPFGPPDEMALVGQDESGDPLFPVIRIHQASIQKMLGNYARKFTEAEHKIRTTGKPASFYLRGRTLLFHANLEKQPVTGQNLIATVPGRSKKDEYLVISAHYDHIGTQGGQVFNGADDNASGTTAVLMLAQYFQQHPCERSLLFLFVSGEEHGLLGSEYFINHPVVPKSQLAADINLDMIGRNDSFQIGVIPSHTERVSTLNDFLQQANRALPQPFRFLEDMDDFDERSDHFNFSANGVPSIFLFSGDHEDYHRPTDDWEKLDFDKIERVYTLTRDLIERAANAPEPIRFKQTPAAEGGNAHL